MLPSKLPLSYSDISPRNFCLNVEKYSDIVDNMMGKRLLLAGGKSRSEKEKVGSVVKAFSSRYQQKVWEEV